MDIYLKLFIEGKIQAYQEPMREGTQRGDIIGFSRVKLACAYWSAAGLMPKEIKARVKQVNYGSLLCWRTRDDFVDRATTCKKEIENYCEQYFQEQFAIFKWVLNQEKPEVKEEIIRFISGKIKF